MKNKYLLSIAQARYLLSIIFIAMVFKVITVKDIEYSDGIIKNIDGISFKKNNLKKIIKFCKSQEINKILLTCKNFKEDYIS